MSLSDQKAFDAAIALFDDPAYVVDDDNTMNHAWHLCISGNPAVVMHSRHSNEFTVNFDLPHWADLISIVSLDAVGPMPDIKGPIADAVIGCLPRDVSRIVAEYAIPPLFDVVVEANNNAIFTAPVFALPFTGFPKEPFPITSLPFTCIRVTYRDRHHLLKSGPVYKLTVKHGFLAHGPKYFDDVRLPAWGCRVADRMLGQWPARA